MKSLKTLIKLKQREIDVIRREIGILQEQRARHENRLKELAEELRAETELAANMVDMSGFFGDFSEAIRNKEDDVHNQIRKLELKLEALAEKVREHFSEQKKYEIALENQMKEEKKKRERREQLMLDEIAAQQHHRRLGGEA